MVKKAGAKLTAVCDKRTAKNIYKTYATKSKNVNNIAPKRNLATTEALRQKRKR